MDGGNTTLLQYLVYKGGDDTTLVRSMDFDARVTQNIYARKSLPIIFDFSKSSGRL